MAASHLQCLCGAINEPASLLASPSLPIETELCHCNPCRQSSGALCPAFAKLKCSPLPSSLGACTRYSRPDGRIDRYFCTKCGSRMFDYNTATDSWFACSGIIERIDDDDGSVENVIRVTSHEYVADAGDGGLAVLMQRLGGRPVPCYAQEPRGATMTDEDLVALSSEHRRQGERKDRLLASCHCGSTEFYILPPQRALGNLDDSSVAKWLRKDGTRYLALNCACNYCRRAFGFSFASNTYVMPENIVTADDQQMNRVFDYTSQDETASDFTSSTEALQTTFPKLVFDFSSPGIRRSFCGVCGASVFFERASRPQCVNVSVGILRAGCGSLARDWIDFDWEIWWKDRAVDKELVEALELHRI